MCYTTALGLCVRRNVEREMANRFNEFTFREMLNVEVPQLFNLYLSDIEKNSAVKRFINGGHKWFGFFYLSMSLVNIWDDYMCELLNYLSFRRIEALSKTPNMPSYSFLLCRDRSQRGLYLAPSSRVPAVRPAI